MKDLIIEGKEYSVPDSIESVELFGSGTSNTDGGYYQTRFEIKTTSGESHACVVNVQLCGATYQSQNGCYLDGEYSLTNDLTYGYDGNEFINPFEYDYSDSEAYTKEAQEMDEFIGTLQSIAVRMSESKAESDTKERIDEESETQEGETWEHLRTLESDYHSATSHIETVLEKSSNDRFRVIKRMNGFVQPNDYAVEIEPELIAVYENEDEYNSENE